ncbi:MbnP family protein [Tenacibaculum xiamenense]|uniref:MbnP family protein n=1 Tax=Tenacibaculum xiamenense TaxID=1261553 RepID=UPI003894193D
MKKFAIIFLSFFILCCSADNDEPIKQVSVKLNFTHNWGGTALDADDFNKFDFENQESNVLSIERLRYLISRINLIKSNNDTIKFEGYKLVVLDSLGDGLIHELPETISEGTYNLSFTFGFDDNDNISGNYPDLNTANWNVHAEKPGGYHFLQLDGKFKDTTDVQYPYEFHAIKAYDAATDSLKDTSFKLNLGSVSLTNNATIEIKMDLSEWFKNPHAWDLTERSTDLMMNFDAQLDMSDNGKNVFRLGGITQ